MREQEILELLLLQEEAGINALLRHYGPLMRYVIAPILPDPQDCEECLSESALRAWERIDQFDRQKGTLRAWLTAISRNAALDRARKLARASRTEELSAAACSPPPTPEELLLQKEQREALARALKTLTKNELALFYRKYYYLQPTAQIASELSMTERAVEGKLYRLNRKLRDLLGGEGIE